MARKNRLFPAAIWAGMGMLMSLAVTSSVSAQGINAFKEELTYVNNNRLGERLSVSFPNGKTETVRTTQLTISEEVFYSSITNRFEKRMIGVVTGMGMGTTGLKLVLDDTRQIEEFVACLKSFIRTHNEFAQNRDLIESKTEKWMGESWAALGKGRPIGEVYFYPSKTDLLAEFKWDFELDRVWLSIGSRIIVDQEVVSYVQLLVENIERYRDLFFEYRESLNQKNSEIDELLGIKSDS